MSAIHHPGGSGVPECWLLLFRPSWPVKIRYSIEADHSEGLTGIEYRSAKARGVRLSMTWSCSLNASESDALRQALYAMGDARIGVPLWPDFYCGSSGWLHAPQKVVSWNSSGGYAISGVQGSYAHPNAAPLLVGRLKKRPSMQLDGKVLWNVEFSLDEDSPWECRIDPASGYIPGSFVWDPDWNDLVDRSKDQLRASDLGNGREAGVAGGDGSPKWGQEAQVPFFNRGEIADFLRFWVDRQGSIQSFPCPAWAQSGLPTVATPSELTSRFDKDVVELRFVTPHVADSKVLLWQEVSTGTAQNGPSKAYLYTFTWDEYPPVRFTDWEHDLVHGSDTYATAPITHDELQRTLTPIGDECEVIMFEQYASNPMKPMVSGEAERRLSVEITLVRVSVAGVIISANTIFAGDIVSAEVKEDTIVGHAKTLGGLFERKLPRFYVQKGCNYTLADGCCKLLKASLARSAAITGVSGSSVITWGAVPSLPATYQDKWFAGGWIECVGTDGSRHRRAILDSSRGTSSYSLTLNRALPSVCEGVTATAYPGCSGDYSMCSGKFANASNFGGFPYLPAYLSTSNGNGSSPKAK